MAAAVLPPSPLAPGPDVGNDWGDEQVAEAIALFEAGKYAEAQAAANDAMTATRPATREGERRRDAGPKGPEASAGATWQASGNRWRLALDELATAHEESDDAVRAEGLYLRMLAWREGTEQFRQGHFPLAVQLFGKSPDYRTVEDATWFLQGLRPDDGHAIADVVSLLALGEEVATKAAVGIWTLALRKEQRPTITECGGLELIAKAVAYHVENAELQAAGCGALKLLCSGHRLAPRNRRALLGRLGGVEALVSTLQYHAHDPEVQREACGALRAAATKHPAGARRIVEGGGVTLCLNAVAGCRNEAVGEAARRALEALQCASALQPGTRIAEVGAEDIEAVMEAKLAAEREQGLRFCEEQLRGRLECKGHSSPQALLGAINVFLEDTNVRHRGVSLMEPVVLCMKAFAGIKPVQFQAVGILCHLTSDHLAAGDAVGSVYKSNALTPVCQAMRDLPTCLELQRLGVTTLRNVTKGGNDLKTLGVKAGGMQVTVAAMHRFPADARLQEQGLGALTCLCDTVGRATRLAGLSGMEAIAGALRRHAATGRVAELGCQLFCMLCEDEPLKRHVARCGGIDIAKSLSRSSKAEVARWARELLQEASSQSARDDLSMSLVWSGTMPKLT